MVFIAKPRTRSAIPTKRAQGQTKKPGFSLLPRINARNARIAYSSGSTWSSVERRCHGLWPIGLLYSRSEKGRSLARSNPTFVAEADEFARLGQLTVFGVQACRVYMQKSGPLILNHLREMENGNVFGNGKANTHACAVGRGRGLGADRIC